ncbi:hypothetical protein J1605_000263 [Eschrichtius robustus]|uniref:Uncharacterized protein n=1 Tax=Eschrichtius robustus TaxID=9764 RepID=A0AB34HM47_ESCRO|nr:hypothetical protein J1605_000263 [Eschrichtius robustus]
MVNVARRLLGTAYELSHRRRRRTGLGGGHGGRCGARSGNGDGGGGGGDWSSAFTPLHLLFFLFLFFPAAYRPLPLKAAPILRYQGAREAEGGPGRWCGLWARGLPSQSGSRGRGRGAVVGGRKREGTGSLTAAASARRLLPPPLRLPPTRLSSSRAHGRQLGLGPAQLAGRGGGAPACWAPRGRRESRRRARREPRLSLFPNPGAWAPGEVQIRAHHCGGTGMRRVGVNVGIRICGVDLE